MVKMAALMVDPHQVGDSDTAPQLANSMLGALLAVVHQTAGDEGVAFDSRSGDADQTV